MAYLDEIGKRIKDRREELLYTQEELAKRLDYNSKASISRIESGKQNLTQTKISAIAEALKTSPAYLMGCVDKEGNYIDDTDRDAKASPNPIQVENDEKDTIQLHVELKNDEEDKKSEKAFRPAVIFADPDDNESATRINRAVNVIYNLSNEDLNALNALKDDEWPEIKYYVDLLAYKSSKQS